MLGDVKEYWAWMLGVGIFFVALGVAGLLYLPLTTMATVFFFGALAITAGVVQLVNGFTHTGGWVSKVANIILALLYILFGALAFYNPVMASAAITLAMAAAFIAIGIVRAWIAWQNKDVLPYWGWIVFSGIISIALGVLIAIQWPGAALWFLGLYVSLDLLFSGATFIGIALAAR
jgi:uncharacterized membrane protein HdeD (DUF308 family)